MQATGARLQPTPRVYHDTYSYVLQGILPKVLRRVPSVRVVDDLIQVANDDELSGGFQHVDRRFWAKLQEAVGSLEVLEFTKIPPLDGTVDGSDECPRQR